jgi:hypothetical protein
MCVIIIELPGIEPRDLKTFQKTDRPVDPQTTTANFVTNALVLRIRLLTLQVTAKVVIGTVLKADQVKE